MSPVLLGRRSDQLLGHVVDDFGNIYFTLLGDLGELSDNPAMQQVWFWDSNYQDPAFCERKKS